MAYEIDLTLAKQAELESAFLATLGSVEDSIVQLGLGLSSYPAPATALTTPPLPTSGGPSHRMKLASGQVRRRDPGSTRNQVRGHFAKHDEVPTPASDTRFNNHSRDPVLCLVNRGRNSEP
jgi:hypothetical protein